MKSPHRIPFLPITALLLGGALAVPGASQAVEVVTTLPAYASIASEIVGDLGHVDSISRGDEDAHFVKPKPSFALMLKRADLFVTTGLDLELWAPVLVDKSGNRTIRVGGNGYVSASEGVTLLDVPASADRSAGDVHIYGNPHIFTSPLNAKVVAADIARGLSRVDPANKATYEKNLADFQRRIDVALYGQQLVDLLGSETLDPLAHSGTLVSFLRDQTMQGRPAIDLLGGWLGKGLSFRDKEIVAYHKNWIYFTELFGLKVVDYVEPKPGIPPSARHVHELIEEISARKIGVLLAANYFSRQEIDTIADRTGCRAVVVPLGTGSAEVPTYFDLVDFWVNSLADAFQSGGTR